VNIRVVEIYFKIQVPGRNLSGSFYNSRWFIRLGWMVDFDRIWNQVKDKPGVNGINEGLTDEGKVQVTVSRMTPRAESEIPESLDGGDGERYEVELVEIGEIRPFKKKLRNSGP